MVASAPMPHPWIPASAGMTKKLDGRSARWIPVFAGMTKELR